VPGDFLLKTHVTYQFENLYDQCGLMIRADAENWIKVSVEYENKDAGRLGSVVTNLGYSDWATQDIPSTQREMWYQIRKRGNDFLIESSVDGRVWEQMRVTHMHRLPEVIEVGLYACSPINGGFRCHFDFLEILPNDWYYHVDGV
jgi:regulation of enolase protein 1 (concanavalin A-like superfamily)